MADGEGEILQGIPVHWDTFLDIPPSEAEPSRCRIIVIPCPYDGTESYKGGTAPEPS